MVVAVVLGLATAFQAHCASVLRVGLDDMTRDSELVFEGTVTSVAPRLDRKSDVIRTHVTFEVHEVIKGSAAGDSVELSFLGGTIGDTTQRVAEMSVPAPGTTGIYFVESLGRPQVHPLYGWSQGHIAVVADTNGVHHDHYREPSRVQAIHPDVFVFCP